MKACIAYPGSSLLSPVTLIEIEGAAVETAGQQTHR
jgi:hypothetical protein